MPRGKMLIMKKHIQIKDSYNIWKPSKMRELVIADYRDQYWDFEHDLSIVNDKALIVEWWLHNIGYWVTLPFISVAKIRSINVRCQHVDLMVDMKEGDQ